MPGVRHRTPAVRENLCFLSLDYLRTLAYEIKLLFPAGVSGFDPRSRKFLLKAMFDRNEKNCEKNCEKNINLSFV